MKKNLIERLMKIGFDNKSDSVNIEDNFLLQLNRIL